MTPAGEAKVESCKDEIHIERAISSNLNSCEGRKLDGEEGAELCRIFLDREDSIDYKMRLQIGNFVRTCIKRKQYGLSK